MHPENCTEPLLRKDYVKLIKAVMLRADVFSKRQQAQLEVYSVWVSGRGRSVLWCGDWSPWFLSDP